MTFTASELDPPLARWPDVAHVAEEGCRCSSSFPSYASRSGSHFFSTRESSLRLPSSLSRRINRSNLTNYRILLSGPLPTDEVSSSPFFSFPSTSSSFHPRNQKRSPPEQFYPFVGKRLGPARKPGDNPLPPSSHDPSSCSPTRASSTPFVAAQRRCFSSFPSFPTRVNVNYQRPDNSVIRAQCRVPLSPSLSLSALRDCASLSMFLPAAGCIVSVCTKGHAASPEPNVTRCRISSLLSLQRTGSHCAPRSLSLSLLPVCVCPFTVCRRRVPRECCTARLRDVNRALS